jgi:hypothetical protein
LGARKLATEVLVTSLEDVLARLVDDRVRALVKDDALREPDARGDDQELHELAARRAAVLRRARAGGK